MEYDLGYVLHAIDEPVDVLFEFLRWGAYTVGDITPLTNNFI
jgi:hypothetical protein